MVGPEDNTCPVAQIECDALLARVIDFAWPSGQQILGVRSGTEISQSAFQLFGYPSP